MIIDLSEIMLEGLNGRSRDTQTDTVEVKSYTIRPDFDTLESRMGTYKIASNDSFVLDIKKTGNNKAHLSGEINISLFISCDRCLEDVKTDISFDLDRDICFSPEDENYDESSFCITEGLSIDMDKVLYSEILMNIPMKVLCKEDCKGICPVCGTNLNRESCECDTFVPDPRMSVFSDVFKNFEKQ